MEDAYYLGRDVKAVFFAHNFAIHNLHTYEQLKACGEYRIGTYYCQNTAFGKRSRHLYAGTQDLYPLLSTHCPLFDLYINKWRKERKGLTAGLIMLACGLALGYTEIYCVGIDLYEGVEKYAFAQGKNLLRLNPYFVPADFPYNCGHDKALEIEFVQKASAYLMRKGGGLYVLSEDSPLAAYVSVPQEWKRGACALALPEPKPVQALRDMCMLSGGRRGNPWWCRTGCHRVFVLPLTLA